MEGERGQRRSGTVRFVIVVCEGRTEQAFVTDMLSDALLGRGLFIEPRLIPTSPSGRGGALSGQRVVRFLRDTLRERRDTYVTTFFDLYGLPADFPGLVAAPRDPLERSAAIESAFHEEVVRAAGCRSDRFLPHIQPYEFEALLFSDTAQFGRVRPAWAQAAGSLEAARRGVSSPEHVNDGPNTHPSARLLELPGYRKVRHGVAVAARIGLERIRQECRHFAAWLSRIETLPATG